MWPSGSEPQKELKFQEEERGGMGGRGNKSKNGTILLLVLRETRLARQALGKPVPREHLE